MDASRWRSFPPRLDWQPIFYPVLTEEYATVIARDWNTKDQANGAVGYVLRFDVDDEYIARHEVHTAGSREFCEHWIPADEVDEFIAHIRGEIKVVAEYRGDPPRRVK
jgi:hypothetical protein